MPNEFLSPEGDLEYYFVTDSFIIDQYVGDTLWVWGAGANGRLGNNATTDRSTPVNTIYSGTDWRDISAGGSHTAAIKTDGTLWTWGLNTSAQLGDNTATTKSIPVVITEINSRFPWRQVSAGNNHTAAVNTNGTLWVWGLGSAGRLGINATTNRSTPVTTFAGGTNWKQVSAGNTHTAAIKTDGTLWTWGNNASAQLGNNDTTNRSTPVTTFAGGTDWKQVSSGGVHTAAIKTDGTLWVWGSGTYGELGDTNINVFLTPVTTFAGGTTWSDAATTNPEDLYTLSAGDAHTAAIKTDGTLWVWGLNTSAQLGINDASTRVTPVTTFAGGTNWAKVSSSMSTIPSTAAIKTDGTLWTWGSGSSGLLGNNATTNRSTPVTTFAGGTDWKQVSAGAIQMAAVKTDGTLWTWGSGAIGALGINATTNRSTPVTTFAGGTNWKQVSVGGQYTAAIKTDGTLWTWGNNSFAQLGVNDTTNRSTPVTTFAGGTDWKQVSSSDGYCAAIKTDGTLWTWGLGTLGRLGTNDTTNRSTPVTTFAGGTNWKQVSAGGQHTAAVKTDGTLWTWGRNFYGQLGTNDGTTRSTPVTTFAGGTNWKQVSAGSDHTIALRDDGVNKELFGFGNSLIGQLGIPLSAKSTPVTTFAGGTNWKQVSAGGNHTAAIKTDGTLWVWGLGDLGQIGNNKPNDISFYNTPVTTFAGGTDWKDVSTGGSHTAAIKTDGTLWVWGYNFNGQLGTNDVITRSTPVTVDFGGEWSEISSGLSHTAAIKRGITLEVLSD